MTTIHRRHFLGSTAAAGAALVAGSRLAQAAASAGAELTPGVPEGIASYVTMGRLPGKEPLIQLADRPPNFRGAARIS